jgi:hypothetical protein
VHRELKDDAPLTGVRFGTDPLRLLKKVIDLTVSRDQIWDDLDMEMEYEVYKRPKNK